jgi:hypothetical protein
MTDDPLRDALRALPAPPPRPGFTARVLARLDAASAARRQARVARWSAAAAAALLAAGLGAWTVEREQAARRAELAALQRDAARLEAELEALEAASREEAPMLYLGGTEEVDLVLDLRRFAATPLDS